MSRKTSQNEFIIKVNQNGKTRLLHFRANNMEQASKKAKKTIGANGIIDWVRSNKTARHAF